jgi:hypothetical protein
MNKLFILFFILPFFGFSQKTLSVEYPPQAEEDSIKSRTKVIDAIFMQDKISLLVGSNGCFHSVSVEYSFVKKADYFEATYIKTHSRTIKCKGKVKLSNEKMEQIHKLCVYGLSIKQGGCTTSVAFELTAKAQKISFNDDRCANEDDLMNRIGEIVGVCKDF